MKRLLDLGREANGLTFRAKSILWFVLGGRMWRTKSFKLSDADCYEMTPAQMRRLAAMLTKAADKIDKKTKP